jgi:hypothetical protein
LNGLRIALTILALVLDGLCLILLVAVFFLANPTPSAMLGIGIFAVVILGNLPPLIWGLARSRRPAPTAEAADVFS